MRLLKIMVVGSMLAAGAACAATKFVWAGGRQPAKLTTPKTGKVNIGDFIALASKDQWGQVIYNVAKRYPDARPWITWGVGPWPEFTTPLSDAQQEEYLTYLDGINVDVYLDTRPGSASVVNLIDTYMTKFSKHPCVKGFGVDLEFYAWKGGKDADAKAMLAKLKSFNPAYKLFFKHWESANMPSDRSGDMIYFCTSSEDAIPTLVSGHAAFANALAPAPVAFQIGYPADEALGSDHVHSCCYDGWQKLADPIKDWGDMLLKAVTSSTQQLGFVWVTVKSDRFAWDLTQGAVIPTAVAKPMAAPGRFLRVERGARGLSVKLDGSSELLLPPIADIQGRKVMPSQGAGLASGRYFLRTSGQTLSAGFAK